MAALALAVGVTVAPPGPAAEGTTVQMVDNEPDLTNWHFDPAQLTVPAGSTVVWHNRGHEEHSITADDKSFDSGYKKPGTDFQRAFPRVGKFSYHCAPHPWMTGVIQVVAAPTTTTTVPAPTTTAPPAGAAPTTLPPSSPGAGTPAAPGDSGTTTSAPGATSPSTSPGTADGSASSPAAKTSQSKRDLVGTLALVLIPTLGALLVGARLRRPKS